MSRLNTELAHMVRMLTASEHSRRGWKAHLWDKAQKLAETDPEFSELPRLLTEEMQKPASSPSPSKPPEPDTR